MITIKIPPQLTSLNVIKFNLSLKDYRDAKGYRFDFSERRFAEPFAMLFLAQSIHEFVKINNSTATCEALIIETPSKNSPCSYLAHMGFFTDVGIKYGKQTG